MKHVFMAPLAAVIVLGMIFTGCEALNGPLEGLEKVFKGESGGEAPLPETATANNVKNILKLTKNDKTQSLRALTLIKDSLAGADPADRAALQTAAVQSALNATGLFETILNGGGGAIDGLISGEEGDPDRLGGVLDSLLTLPNNKEASPLIIASLSDVAAGDDAQANFIAQADKDKRPTADEVALAGLTVIFGDEDLATSSGATTAEKLETYIKKIATDNPGVAAPDFDDPDSVTQYINELDALGTVPENFIVGLGLINVARQMGGGMITDLLAESVSDAF
ncbi:hypothetical protein FACS1894172_02300 [Spirochaetia bacterium]|nr:hypothetical protein FACS1894172_02300 [Spirochaetia bacterium]